MIGTLEVIPIFASRGGCKPDCPPAFPSPEHGYTPGSSVLIEDDIDIHIIERIPVCFSRLNRPLEHPFRRGRWVCCGVDRRDVDKKRNNQHHKGHARGAIAGRPISGDRLDFVDLAKLHLASAAYPCTFICISLSAPDKVLT